MIELIFIYKINWYSILTRIISCLSHIIMNPVYYARIANFSN